MDYGQLRKTFLNILNRSDVTPEEADTFIAFGIRRAERLLRTPLQDGVYSVSPSEPTTEFAVPNDYLGLIELRVDGEAYERITKDEMTRVQPAYTFALNRSRFEVYPAVSEGSTFELHYYKGFDVTTNEDRIMNWSLVIPDVIIYASLTYAADTYTDERKQSWTQTVGQLVEEVQMQADMDALAGHAIQPMEDYA